MGNPITHDVKLLVKDMLMPLTQDTKLRALLFENQLKTEMFADLKYVHSLEKEDDELQTDKNEFSKEYDLLLQECISKDIMCSILRTLSDLDEQTEVQCLYLEKHEECDILEIELSKHKSQFAELEKHSQLQDKNTVISDLKAQLKEKEIANAEIRESWNKMKGKDVDTNFGKPSILGKPPLQEIKK
ncbi:hypothetical protein Tco_0298484 [Tanacetum coccineum]